MQNDPYSLSQLRDIIEPAPIPFWSPTLGFWFILALVLLWAIAGCIIWWRRWRRNAYRRVALGELDVLKSRIENLDTRASALQELSELLKRVALAAYPREQVASLTGKKWLEFLDETMGGREFSSGPGHLLVSAIFEPDPASSVHQADCEHLIPLARHWIGSHQRLLGQKGNVS